MQILVQVLCPEGQSLREAIANDGRLESFNLQVVREKQPGRAICSLGMVAGCSPLPLRIAE